MEFITREDFYTHMYENVIVAIEDDNEESLTEAIDTAQSEAFGYLSRFDLDAIMTSEDKKKYAILRTYLKDMAKWHFINVCHVSTDLQLAETRYLNAIARLKEIALGKLTPEGWPLKQNGIDDGAYLVTSREKRENHY